jgi:hypothetical protein
VSEPIAGVPTRRYGAVVVVVAVSYAVAAGWDGNVGLAAVVLTQLVTLWLVFSVTQASRLKRLVLAVACAAGVVALGVVVGGFGIARVSLDEMLPGVLSGLLAALYALSPLVLIHDVLRRRVVDVQTVLGAIASYLLIGMAFAFTYVTVQAGQTAPFFGDQGAAEVGTSLFFSFTTLTTTGYGNLVPAADPGQSLAVAEVVLGQLFLVTAVAKVVADYPGRRRPREGGEHLH